MFPVKVLCWNRKGHWPLKWIPFLTISFPTDVKSLSKYTVHGYRFSQNIFFQKRCLFFSVFTLLCKCSLICRSKYDVNVYVCTVYAYIYMCVTLSIYTNTHTHIHSHRNYFRLNSCYSENVCTVMGLICLNIPPLWKYTCT